MKPGFKAYFLVELKQVLKKRNIVILGVIVLILIFSIEHGRGKLKQINKEKIEFQRFEAKKVQQYIYLSQYGGFGFCLFFSPSPLSIITDSDLDLSVISKINAHNELEIYKNFKNNSVFSSKNFNYSNLIIFFGGIFSLLYGMGAISNKEYIKFWSSIIDHMKLFKYILLSRSIIFVASFFLIHLFILLILLMHGINLFSEYSFAFLITQVMVFVLFIFIGCGIGTIKKKETAQFCIWVAFAIFLLGLPFGLNIMTEKIIGKSKSSYQVGYKNLSIIMTIESELISRYGKYNEEKGISQEIKKKLENATNNEYKRVKQNEIEVIKDLERGMLIENLISAIFPVTFSKSISKEMGGEKGCQNLIKFYRVSLSIKDGFTKYFFKKNSKMRKPKMGTIESYIKGDENIYQAMPLLPSTFPLGVIIDLLYISLAGWVVYLRYRKLFLFSVPDEIDETKDLNTKALNCILTRNPAIEHFIFLDLINRNTHLFTIDSNPIETDFIYIPAVLPFSNKVFSNLLGLGNELSNRHFLEIAIRYAAKNKKGLIIGGALDQIDEERIIKIKNLIYKYNVLTLHIGRDRYTFKAFADKHIRYKNDKSIDINGNDLFKKRKMIKTVEGE